MTLQKGKVKSILAIKLLVAKNGVTMSISENTLRRRIQYIDGLQGNTILVGENVYYLLNRRVKRFLKKIASQNNLDQRTMYMIRCRKNGSKFGGKDSDEPKVYEPASYFFPKLHSIQD